VVKQYAFGTIVDTLRLTLVCIWITSVLRGEGDQLVDGAVNNHNGRSRRNALDPVARWGANLVDQLEWAVHTTRKSNSGEPDLYPAGA
jgi:hypothetical protein